MHFQMHFYSLITAVVQLCTVVYHKNTDTFIMDTNVMAILGFRCVQVLQFNYLFILKAKLYIQHI